MTPKCCNCLYFRERKRTCHNPDSVFYHDRYHEELRYVDECKHWEHWKEFAALDGRRLKLGKKR